MTTPSRRGFLKSLGVGSLAAGFSEAALAQPKTVLSEGHEADDERYWRWVADEFLTQPEVAHMNTGTRGVSPRNVVKAQFEAIRSYDSDYISHADFVMNKAARTAIREKLAAFVGCTNREIAITNNTTEGMAFGTAGLDLKPGDEVIYTNHDHSGGAQPINLCAARMGIKPVIVDLSKPEFHPPENVDVILDAFDKAITPRTRLISFCHINYTDGCVMPAREICELARSKGVLTLIDGAHPPGMMPLDITALGCDMYSGAGHKWLLASMLTGFFYVNEAVQDRVWPIVYSGPVNGRNMLGGKSDNEQATTAARYEMRGSHNFAKLASLDAALDFHNELTPLAIEARDRYLATRTIMGLQQIPGVDVFVAENSAFSCGIVSFRIQGVDPIEVNDLLWNRHRIYIRNVTKNEIDWNVNRASLHIMVHAGQVDTLIGAVEEIARERKV